MPTTDQLKQATTVASHYGFAPLESVLKKYPRRECLKKLAPCEVPIPQDILGEELHFLIRNCINSTIPKNERPLQVYHVNAPTSSKQAKNVKHPRLTLTVLGIEKSIAEALILKSTITILKETQGSVGHVHVNSVGDKDSTQRFTRELTQYLRKNVNDMPTLCREALKRGAIESLYSLFEKKHPIVEQAPRTMQFLSDASRRHLKEVVEFLEMSEVPYTVNNQLMNSGYHSQVLFEIHHHNNTEENSPTETEEINTTALARGGRFDEFTRKFSRTSFPVVSAVIELRGKNFCINNKKWTPPRTRRPKTYLIQLGSRAKLQSLLVIEILRLAHIPVSQAIGDDTLTTQLEEVEAQKIPYAIIIGQREALDNTIIIRDMATHSQEIIPISKLVNHLNKIL